MGYALQPQSCSHHKMILLFSPRLTSLIVYRWTEKGSIHLHLRKHWLRFYLQIFGEATRIFCPFAFYETSYNYAVSETSSWMDHFTASHMYHCALYPFVFLFH